MAKYIVNHGGVIHSVNDDAFALAMVNGSRPPSPEDPTGKPARVATPDEIVAWWAAQGFIYDPATDEARPASENASESSVSEKKAAK